MASANRSRSPSVSATSVPPSAARSARVSPPKASATSGDSSAYTCCATCAASGIERDRAPSSAIATSRVTFAYEPIWAIGTGETATAAVAQAACAFIRQRLHALGGAVADEVRIQYGGSVNAENAAELLSQPDIDGALVGGAALKADQFAAICAAARA